MKPVKFFNSIEEELEYLRGRIKTTQFNASVRPENCADCKNLLKGIADDLKTYTSALVSHERSEFFERKPAQ